MGTVGRVASDGSVMAIGAVSREGQGADGHEGPQSFGLDSASRT